MAEPFYTCCDDGMLSQVPPNDHSGLCPACQRERTAVLTDDDWQAVADESDYIVPRVLRQAIERRLRMKSSAGVATSGEKARRAATRADVLSDVDPVVLEVWKQQGRKVGAMLREAQASVIELQEQIARKPSRRVTT